MIVLGPILFVFFLGIFCLLMDCLYPECNIQLNIKPKQNIQKQSSLLSDYADDRYENDVRYDWDDDSDLIAK